MPPMTSEPEWVRKAREMGEAQGKSATNNPSQHDWANYDANDPRARDATRDRMGFGGTEGGAKDYSWRARGRAEESGTRPTYAGAAPLQGHQAGSLAALSGAANGTAPSQAAILAKQQSDAAVNAAQSAAGSVKGGPGARVAAMRAAMGGQAMQQQAGAQTAAAARANEMAQARGAYAQASGAALSDDRLNEARQRSLNDAREMGYEQLGYAASAQDQNNQLAQEQLATTRWGQGRQAEMADETNNWNKVGDIASMGSGAVMGLAGMLSDGRTKNMASLDDAMQASFDGRGEDSGVKYGYFSDPYAAGAPEVGVAGAPKGYAAMRAGQPGSMFGDQPAEDTPLASPGGGSGRSWRSGGKAIADAGKSLGKSMRSDMTTKNAIPYGSLAPMMRSDMRSKDYMTSDARAKREAYELGRAHANEAAEVTPNRRDLNESERRRRIERQNVYRQDPSADPEKAAETAAEQANASGHKTRAQFDRLQGSKETGMKRREEDIARGENLDGGESEYWERMGMVKPGSAPAARQPEPVARPMSSIWDDAVAMVRSDERAKNVIDLDEETIDLDKPEGTAMRDGSSDPRTNSFDKTFRRDTKADQKRVKKGVEDKAGKDADELLASFKSRSKEGPKVAAKDGYLPDAAMFAAMKSMKPAAYTYKPEFAEPGRDPNEIFVGPKDAREMEKDPIAGTAVVREPGTDLRAIDKDKALRLTMGSLAVLANDVQKLKKRRR